MTSAGQALNSETKPSDAAAAGYTAACAACGGPPLPAFVRYNESHLPSTLPSRFLGAHAAFCIRDGEAPLVPDYLCADSDAAAPDSVRRRQQNETSDTQGPGLNTAFGHASTSSLQDPPAQNWPPLQRCGKRLQFKTVRRALNFMQEEGLDVTGLKCPLVQSLLHSDQKLPDGPSATGINLEAQAASSPTADTSSSAMGEQTDRPFASNTSNDCAVIHCQTNGNSQSLTSARALEKRKNGPAAENPLLDADSVPEALTAEAPAPGAGDQSGVASGKRRRGLNSAAMRHKNLDMVSQEADRSGLCGLYAACGRCSTPSCKKTHDLAEFMKGRPEDLEGGCVLFTKYGFCPYGCCCRFGNSHIDGEGKNLLSTGREATQEDHHRFQAQFKEQELNMFDDRMRNAMLQKRRCASAKASNGQSDQAVPHVSKLLHEGREAGVTGCASDESQAAPTDAGTSQTSRGHESTEKAAGVLGEGRDSNGNTEQKEWFASKVKGKVFLAPLTTVGNLPFRRLCTRLGADVTVSEMAVAKSLVDGKASELSLLRRHHTEKIYGIQVATGFADVARECGELFREQNITCDFIDINAACPLDQLHRRFKAGSYLLEKPAVVESLVSNFRETCPDTPVTIKVRTAHYGKSHQLHNIIGRLSASGVCAIFAHGRTAQQRYTKSADWNYISSLKPLMKDDVLLIGCGDILSFAEYQHREATANLDALMIGRGALIKPWIFTEIKEQRLWDISASERLELIKEFVNNGLEHWGSDRRGVATTRRFLLEMLSFMHRYIPPVFLEFQPQLIQWRPSPVVGRSDLEVKLSSPDPKDWVEISSMFLGPVPKEFMFIPKHASNSYSVEG